MRNYGTVSPHFWTGKTGKELRKSPEGLIVSLYLVTCPHANMLGLYYVPLLYIAHETGLGIEGASKGLQWAEKAGFCSYDHDTEIVWVHEMARFQIAEQLKPTDKRSIGAQNEYNSLPSNPYLASFYDKYSNAFCMTAKREYLSEKINEAKAPYKPLASQEQEQEQEQDKNICPPSGEPESAKNQNFKKEIQEIFEFWKTTLAKSDQTLLSVKRKAKIHARLKEGYAVEQIKQAIIGCSKSDYHIENKHTDIELICREAGKLDRFIEMSNQTGQQNQQLSHPTDLSKYKDIEGAW